MQKFIIPLLTVVMVVSITLAGCAPATSTPGQPPETSEQPPEEPEVENSMPILTDGTHSWRLKATTFSEEFESRVTGVLEPNEGYGFLQAEFENLSEVSLIKAWDLKATGGQRPDLVGTYAPGGIHVTDGRGDVYPAVFLEASTITLVVPYDQHDFTLYFLDWTPIELDY